MTYPVRRPWSYVPPTVPEIKPSIADKRPCGCRMDPVVWGHSPAHGCEKKVT